MRRAAGSGKGGALCRRAPSCERAAPPLASAPPMATPPTVRRKAKPKGRPILRTFGNLLKLGVGLALVGAAALALMVGIAYSEMRDYQTLRATRTGQQSITVRGADGQKLLAIGPTPGEWIEYADIPPVMADAMLSVEDRRFYRHPGIDPVGMARAAWRGLRGWSRGSDRRLEGASTITQQLARNLFLSNSYSVSRKLREAVLAMALELKLSKREILELYLNKVYFGGGAYGIDAASRLFFSHSARELDLGEAAIIAGLVKAPSNYSPTADVEAAIGRSQVVLNAMAANGVISPAAAAMTEPAEVRLAPQPNQNSVRYFTDWALPQLDTLVEPTTANLEVWTTLDPGLQAQGTRAVAAGVPKGTQGALVSMEGDGAVRAMVGGTDYVRSNYNRATQALRQPGSAFKLFVYLAALEDGFKPEDVVKDAPITIAGWSPRNSSGRFSGAVSLRTAFAYSINTVAARIGQQVGFSTVASMARRFGVTTPVGTQPSMVLGSSEAHLLDMTRAFAAVGEGGHAVTPYGITRVVSDTGEELYRHEADEPRTLVADYVAAEMTDLLQSAVATGSGRAAQIGRPVAGKTGTTSSNKDGWFIGFSSGLTTGVWMGRDDARSVPGLQGGTAPARVWATFMRDAVAGRPNQPFRTEVTLPDWQLEEPDDAYLGEPDTELYGDGNPLPDIGGGLTVDRPPGAPPPTRDGPVLDQDWIDRVTGAQPPADPRGGAPARRDPGIDPRDAPTRPSFEPPRRTPPPVPPPAPLPPRSGQQSSTARVLSPASRPPSGTETRPQP